MKNSPAFQFYARDWLADTDVRMLTLEQRGAYIDLLCFCWERDGLPADSRQLAKLLGISGKRADSLLPDIISLFTEENGLYRHRKLDKIRDEQIARSEKARIKAERRWNSGEESTVIGQAEEDATAMLQHLSSICTGDAIIAGADAVVVSSAVSGEDLLAGIGGSPEGGKARVLPAPRLEPKDDPEFMKFYSAYPRHEAKADAYKAWKALNPNDQLQQTILFDVERRRLSPDWQKERGKYVPLPATYLRGKRWEDEGIQATLAANSDRIMQPGSFNKFQCRRATLAGSEEGAE